MYLPGAAEDKIDGRGNRGRQGYATVEGCDCVRGGVVTTKEPEPSVGKSLEYQKAECGLGCNQGSWLVTEEM